MLFETEAKSLYEQILDEGGVAVDDARIVKGAELERAFNLLVEMGLVQQDADGERWTAQDPSTVQSRVVAPISHEGSRLLEESSHWARVFGTLSLAWRRAPHSDSEAFTYLRGQAIGPYLTGVVAEAEQEILTAQPQSGREAPTIAAAALRDTAALERGVQMRTLYQHSARRSTATRRYVAAVTERGAEVRTLDEFFNRMIVIDRRVAVIPASADNFTAIVVHEPAIVAYLVDVFERSWERGRPFATQDAPVLKDIAAEQRAMTIRMLVEGHSDPVSAKRMGVSARTYAGYIADLKEEFGVETRFQLGYVMGQRGISGSEPTED